MTLTPQIEVAEHALSVLGSALTDYTDPDEDGHRARVVVVGGSALQGFFVVDVCRFGWAPVRFRVGVTVSPAPYEVALEPFEASKRGERG